VAAVGGEGDSPNARGSLMLVVMGRQEFSVGSSLIAVVSHLAFVHHFPSWLTAYLLQTVLLISYLGPLDSFRGLLCSRICLGAHTISMFPPAPPLLRIFPDRCHHPKADEIGHLYVYFYLR
jgi:hypothetical protein